MEHLALYAILYALFALCVLWPPTEFIAAGVTLEHLFGRLLGVEQDNFVRYHLRRTALNVLAHSALPFGFFLYLDAIHDQFSVLRGALALPLIWRTVYTCSLLLPLGAAALVAYWAANDWQCHPTVRDLRQYSANWRAVAAQIDTEYRSYDKFSVALGGIRRVIVTDSWILLVCTYRLHASQQADVDLTLTRADEHRVSHHFAPEDGPPASSVQFLDIAVSNVHKDIAQFTIRLNSAVYSDLRNTLRRPIDFAHDVMVHASLGERFAAAFSEHVDSNAAHELDAATAGRVDLCMGCGARRSDAKIVRGCDPTAQRQRGTDDGQPVPRCQQCFCRPMWCVECMGRWFASRQDQSSPERWLAGKAPCPTCRATFCVLDVRRALFAEL